MKTLLSQWKKEVEKQRLEDRKYLERKLTQMNESNLRRFREEMLGRKRPTNTRQRFAVSNAELDQRKDEAERVRSTSNVERYVDGLGTVGLIVYGSYLRDECGRYDVPLVMVLTKSRLDALPQIQWRPTVVQFLVNSDAPFGDTSALVPIHDKMFPNRGSVDDVFRAPSREDSMDEGIAGRWSRPDDDDNKGVSRKDIRRYIQEEIKRSQPATNMLDGRRQMMAPHLYGPTYIDDSTLRGHEASRTRALQIVEQFLQGKPNATPFSIQTLRRAVTPGAVAFNVKSSSHASSAFIGCLELISKLRSENKTIPDEQRIRRQIRYANELITKIPEGTNIAPVVEAWAQDLAGEGSYSGAGFVFECKALSRAAATKNLQTPSSRNGKGKTMRCFNCKKTGHTKQNCPWGNGRPLPDDMICQRYNSGTCPHTATACDFMHVCNKCRLSGAWHPQTRCFKTTNAQ